MASIHSIERGPAGYRLLIPDGEHIKGKVLALLNKGGILDSKSNGNLHAQATFEPPLSITTLPTREVARWVAERRAHLGFTATDKIRDYLAELELSGKPVPNIGTLVKYNWFDHSTLSTLVRKESEYGNITELRSQPIHTRYRYLVTDYFREREIPVQVEYQGGKEEGAVRAGYAEACVVIVSTGGTMRQEKLREIDTIMKPGEVKPILIYNPELFEDRGSQRFLDQLLSRLGSSENEQQRGFASNLRERVTYVTGIARTFSGIMALSRLFR